MSCAATISRSQFCSFSLQKYQECVNSFRDSRFYLTDWHNLLTCCINCDKCIFIKWKYKTAQSYLTLRTIYIRVSGKFCISPLFVRTGYPENRGSKPYGWAKNFSFSTASRSLSTGSQEQSGYGVKITSHLHLLPQVNRIRVVCPFSCMSFNFRPTFIVFVVRYPRFGGTYCFFQGRIRNHHLKLCHPGCVKSIIQFIYCEYTYIYM
jgi:hypothetical protein